MKVMTLPGVFAPRTDSLMLADAVRRECGRGCRVLDLCTGSGVVAIAAAMAGATVTAVDVSLTALLTTRWNARRAGVHLQVRRGSLFEPVRGSLVDCISANPPYVPSPDDRLPRHGRRLAWVAGHDGRAVIDQIIESAPRHLMPGGLLLLVHSSLVGEEVTLDRLDAAGFVATDVIDRHRGPLGPLMREQQAMGTVDPLARDEELLVIHARSPDRCALGT